MNLPYSDDLRSFSIFFLFSERKDVDVEIALYAAALNENERTLLISIIHLMFVLSAYHFEEQVGFAPYSWRDPFHAPWKLLDIYSVIIFSAAAISDSLFFSLFFLHLHMPLFFLYYVDAILFTPVCHSVHIRIYRSAALLYIFPFFYMIRDIHNGISSEKKRWGGEVFAINFALGPRTAAATDISSLRLYGGERAGNDVWISDFDLCPPSNRTTPLYSWKCLPIQSIQPNYIAITKKEEKRNIF